MAETQAAADARRHSCSTLNNSDDEYEEGNERLQSWQRPLVQYRRELHQLVDIEGLPSQMQKIDDNQVRNSEGGCVWEVNDLTKLRRFLILGTEGGNYYTNEAELTMENAKNVVDMIENGRGLLVLRELLDISLKNRAAKQNPTLFTLAVCVKYVPEVPMEAEKLTRLRTEAYKIFPLVCRIPTHVFLFIQYCKTVSKSSGWGRQHRNAIGDWYLSKDAANVAFLITKYPQRNKWSHRDLLRLSHCDPRKARGRKRTAEESNDMDNVFLYATKGWEELKTKRLDFCYKEDEPRSKAIKFLEAVEDVKKAESVESVIWFVREFKLAREHIPTQMLNSKEMWIALLEDMPMTAMIRNLAKMTVVGLIGPGSEYNQTICSRLMSEDTLKKAKIHPFAVLLAHHTYKKGRGDKGSLTWTPVQEIVDALDNAFYLSFSNVPPTGKKYLIALDVSGSMTFSTINGTSIER